MHDDARIVNGIASDYGGEDTLPLHSVNCVYRTQGCAPRCILVVIESVVRNEGLSDN